MQPSRPGEASAYRGGIGRSWPDRKWLTLAVVALGTLMTSLDASIVNISLPSIAHTFHTPLGGAIEWVVIAYLVVIAATLLTFGRLSDLAGRKAVWMAGLAVFTFGSAWCGAAGSLPQLICGRVLQGLGGALIFAPGFAIITDTFSAADRGRALGLNGVVFAIGTSLGPTLGGLITEHLSWRWIFYLNVPLSVLALVASRRVLTSSDSRAREGLDLPGAGLIAVGFACITLALSFSQEWSWMRLLACFLIGLVMLVAAGLVDRRARYPVVDLALFRNRVLSSAMASMALAMVAAAEAGAAAPARRMKSAPSGTACRVLRSAAPTAIARRASTAAAVRASLLRDARHSRVVRLGHTLPLRRFLIGIRISSPGKIRLPGCAEGGTLRRHTFLQPRSPCHQGVF